ncbi:MAG: AIR synthase related protein, partial [Methanomicrobium sp.]|nr:AIR synthase related protein [Methanomicrobium sp.]
MDDREIVKRISAIIGFENTEDDCAKIPFGDKFLVASTDMLHEKTDFPKGITDWQIGWMSAAVTLSDIASTGAEPISVLLAAGLD